MVVSPPQPPQGQSDGRGLFESEVPTWTGRLPSPPSSVMDPLVQLDEYLRRPHDDGVVSVGGVFGDETNDDGRGTAAATTTTRAAAAAEAAERDRRVDELLQVVEFLYGQTLLSSSLALIDTSLSSSPLHPSMFTRLVAPSGRSVHLVLGSTVDTTYLCLVGDAGDGGSSTSSNSIGGRPIHYCSCRSYLEKSTKGAAMAMAAIAASGPSSSSSSAPAALQHGPGVAGTSTGQLGPPLCKHLLALKLLPCLGGDGSSRSGDGYDGNARNHPTTSTTTTTVTTPYYRQQVIVTATEEEFAQLVLDRVWGGRY